MAQGRAGRGAYGGPRFLLPRA